MLKKIWKSKLFRILILFHGALLVAAILLLCHLLYKNHREYTAAMETAPFDAIIVPGVPFRDGTWSGIMQLRVYWAKHLYDSGIGKNIIFSGSAVYSPYTESEIMKAYAIELGLPDSVLSVETMAEHSSENLHYSLIMAKEKGFKTVALASDPFQSYMLTFFRESQGIDVAFLPSQHAILKNVEMENPEIEHESALVKRLYRIAR